MLKLYYWLNLCGISSASAYAESREQAEELVIQAIDKCVMPYSIKVAIENEMLVTAPIVSENKPEAIFSIGIGNKW